MPDFLINLSASGTTSLVAPPSLSQSIRLLEYSLSANGSTELQLFDGATLKAVHYLKAGYPLVINGTAFDGAIDCSPGNALLISSTNSVSVGGFGKYAIKSSSPVTLLSSPVNTVLPSISGPPFVGQVLTVVSGTFTGTVTSVAYIWYSNGTQVGTGTTYTAQASDSGATITVKETATGPGGSTSATSAGITIVAAVFQFSASNITGFTNGQIVPYTYALDQSGSGNNPTAGAGAVYTTNAVNGLPALIFSGVNYYALPFYLFNGPFTVVAVVSQIVDEPFTVFLGSINTGAIELGLDTSTPTKLAFSRTGQVTTASDLILPADSTFHVVVWRSGGVDQESSSGNYQGMQCQIIKDQDIGIGTSVNGVTGTATASNIGRSQVASPSGWLNGGIALFACYSEVLPFSSLTALTQSLATTYGITLTALPAFAVTPQVFRSWSQPGANSSTGPSIALGTSGQFDVGKVEVTSSYFESGTYYCTYTGWNSSLTAASIGFATGPSLSSLVKRGVFLAPNAASSWYKVYVSGSRIQYVASASIYILLFWGSNTASFEGAPGQIGIATMATPIGTPVVQNGGNYIIAPPTGCDIVYRGFLVDNTAVDGLYYIFANARTTSNEQENIYVWTSSSLTSGYTIANSGNPVVSCGGGSGWKGVRVFDCTVLPDGNGGWVMQYCGQNQEPAQPGFATSTGNLLSWTDYARNPGVIAGYGAQIRPCPTQGKGSVPATLYTSGLSDNINQAYPVQLDI